MKKKSVSLFVLSLGVGCTLALAAEYKSPDVKLKKATPTVTEVKTQEFSDDYKVEGVVKTDRQIASEQEPSDREPSSIKTEGKKAPPAPPEETTPEDFGPKPWLYKNKLDAAY